jgi:hypothetical protein
MNNNKNYEHRKQTTQNKHTDIQKLTQIYTRQHRYTQDNTDIHKYTQVMRLIKAKNMEHIKILTYFSEMSSLKTCT